MFILAPLMYNKLLSETIENEEGKSHNCLSGNARAAWARRAGGHWVSLTWSGWKQPAPQEGRTFLSSW